MLLSAFGFALIPVLAVYAYKGGISVITLLFIRFAIATLFFFTYCIASRRKFNLTGKNLLSTFILGVLYTFTSFFYFSSVRYISPSLAAMLFYTYPMFVSILYFILYKNTANKRIIISVAISFSGLLLAFGTSMGNLNLFGALMAVCAALVYSNYIVYGNKIVNQLPSIVTSTLVSLFAALSLLVLGFSTDTISFNFTRQTWLPILGIVLFSTVLAILTFFYGLELLGCTKASIVSMMEPVFTIVLSSLLFGQDLTVMQMFGGVAVLCGAMLGTIPVKVVKKAHKTTIES